MLLNTYTDSIDFNAVTGWVHDTLNAWLPSWEPRSSSAC